MAACSWGAHQLLTRFRLGRFWWDSPAGHVPGGASGGVDVRTQRRKVERSAPAQGPSERPPTLGEIEADRVEVQRCATTGRPVERIGDGAPHAADLRRYHSQQDGPEGTFPATQTRPDRFPGGTS